MTEQQDQLNRVMGAQFDAMAELVEAERECQQLEQRLTDLRGQKRLLMTDIEQRGLMIRKLREEIGGQNGFAV